MNNSQLKNLFDDLSSIQDLTIFSSLPDREKFSKDFFDYSPILKPQLENCLADFVVKPHSVNAVLEVARCCKKNSVALTLRGSGTGNYGQCVPLHKGVVMIMSEINKIKNYDTSTGEVTVETGCLLRDLNDYLSKKGRQLRLLPSTWRSASLGGFIAGGSGGIGSVRWGFLRDPGHLNAMEIITLENNPRKLNLDANKSEALNHAYGTNGIITSLTVATTPLVSWQEVAIDFKEWDKAVKFSKVITEAAIDIFLCTVLEKPIVARLPSWNGDTKDCHRILILVSPDGISTLRRLADMAGANFYHIGTENIRRGRGLRELTWNHTTLHMRSIDPNWTYLQMLLPQPEIPAMEILKREWGDSLLWHLESVRQQGAQRIASLPLVKWKDEESLNKLIKQCEELGAIMFNPHVITVEDGGLGVIDTDQVNAKKSYDPEGLLNPGKLKGWQ